MRNFIFFFVVCVFGWVAGAGTLEGYSEVPTQSDRAKAESGWMLFPGFPRLELVKEGEGTVDPALTALIEDHFLRSRIEAGHFTSLQVRDLAIRAGAAYSDSTNAHFPYAVSVKHAQGPLRLTNGDQGTINVAGEILVHFDGTELHVTVVKFYDSQALEKFGRYLGYNDEIDLDFARAVVKPQLEHWFNSEPSRIKDLLAMAARLPSVQRR